MKPPGFSLSRLWITILTMLVVGGIGVVDYFTGRDLVISAFYLVPICWVTWKVGRPIGLVVALESALAWLAGDFLSGYDYTHPAIPFLNALFLLVMFLTTVFLLSAFQRAHYHLEETVALRTRELQREMEERRRAEDAKIQAERLAVVGTMAAQVAHEVRNPLGAITLNLDLVEDEFNRMTAASPPAGEGIELVGELREEVQRIQRVITDYLVLARPHVPKFERVDLSQLLRRKLALMRGTFQESGVELRLALPDDELVIRADRDQLWQAILNLVRNGMEAMPDGGTLTIETEEGVGTVELRVTDTGCGMTAEQQARLFVPFVTSKAAGTGLGLALVRQCVLEHRGEIACRTAPGQGTSFTITLPLEAEPRAGEETNEGIAAHALSP